MSGEELAMIVTAFVLMFVTSVFGIDLLIPDKRESSKSNQPPEEILKAPTQER